MFPLLIKPTGRGGFGFEEFVLEVVECRFWFVVYDFFETIEKIANENNFSLSQVWNCDETGFLTDPG